MCHASECPDRRQYLSAALALNHDSILPPGVCRNGGAGQAEFEGPEGARPACTRELGNSYVYTGTPAPDLITAGTSGAKS